MSDVGKIESREEFCKRLNGSEVVWKSEIGTKMLEFDAFVLLDPIKGVFVKPLDGPDEVRVKLKEAFGTLPSKQLDPADPKFCLSTFPGPFTDYDISKIESRIKNKVWNPRGVGGGTPVCRL